MKIKIKRIYTEVETDDGYRILIDRLWPRGVSKERAALDDWLKEIAPSTELRKWFNHDPQLFDEFSKHYILELEDKKEELLRIKSIAEQQNVTLLFSAKDEKYNQAVVLKKVLENL